MKISVTGKKIYDITAEAVVIFDFHSEECREGAAAEINQLSHGMIDELVSQGDFRGDDRQIVTLHTWGRLSARRLILAGLGRKAELTLQKLRDASATAARQVREMKLKRFALAIDLGLMSCSTEDIVSAIVEGIILGLYRFDAYKTIEQETRPVLEECILVSSGKGGLGRIRSAVKSAEVVAGAVCQARNLITMPPNDMRPEDLAVEAHTIASSRKAISVRIFDMDDMAKLGMNAILAVAGASHQPARFIAMEYRNAHQDITPIVLVGKGLTFDSGGLSLKPAESMAEMKNDMAGGAVVLETIRAVADLTLPINLVGLVPAAENLPGGQAYKPGDILRSLSGRTIEVVNTDAEGRLLLADALTYAGRYKPQAIIDVATLTGACVVALGERIIGMLGTDQALKEKVRRAALATGEAVWELPLDETYEEQIKSDVADFKNSGGRLGGAITAALFLSKFVGSCPWVHLDIAGPAWAKKDLPCIPKGATGIGVRLLVHLFRHWGEEPPA